MKTVTLQQTGYLIKRTSEISLWGGGSGEINMDSRFIATADLSPKNILRCVNDGSFGVEAITAAHIDIYIQYENGFKTYDRSIYVDHPIHTQYFLGKIKKNT